MMLLKIPCELQKHITIDGHLCKYLLDLIDGEIYGTNSYELYNLYTGMFYQTPPENHEPIKRGCELEDLATPDAWKKGMEQEMERYRQGYRYVSDWVTIKGVQWKRGRWVKTEES